MCWRALDVTTVELRAAITKEDGRRSTCGPDTSDNFGPRHSELHPKGSVTSSHATKCIFNRLMLMTTAAVITLPLFLAAMMFAKCEEFITEDVCACAVTFAERIVVATITDAR